MVTSGINLLLLGWKSESLGPHRTIDRRAWRQRAAIGQAAGLASPIAHPRRVSSGTLVPPPPDNPVWRKLHEALAGLGSTSSRGGRDGALVPGCGRPLRRE